MAPPQVSVTSFFETSTFTAMRHFEFPRWQSRNGFVGKISPKIAGSAEHQKRKGSRDGRSQSDRMPVCCTASVFSPAFGTLTVKQKIIDCS